MLNKKWESDIFETESFLDYFYAISVCGKQSKKSDTMDIDYKKMRQGKINELVDRAKRSNPIVFAAKQFTTVFNNNIWMHGYNRIKKFLERFDTDKTRVYHTLDHLFNDGDRFQPDPGLIEKLVDYLEYDGDRFLTIKTEPQKDIKIFYTLQRFNAMFGFHNFALVPIYKHGLHHVRYDGVGMHTCLSALKKTGGLKRADFNVEH